MVPSGLYPVEHRWRLPAEGLSQVVGEWLLEGGVRPGEGQAQRLGSPGFFVRRVCVTVVRCARRPATREVSPMGAVGCEAVEEPVSRVDTSG